MTTRSISTKTGSRSTARAQVCRWGRAAVDRRTSRAVMVLALPSLLVPVHLVPVHLVPVHLGSGGARLDGAAPGADLAAGTSLLPIGLGAVAVLLLFVVAIMLAMLPARRLARAVNQLRDKTMFAATRALPDTLARLRRTPGLDDNGAAALVAQLPDAVKIDNQDDLGDIARAFNTVHREAVRRAAEEAALRTRVAAVMLDLARRSQAMVESLISDLDELERGEQDPTRLTQLFRLDQLATRMRRHDENILVLAGVERVPPRAEDAPLADILRTAQSEIESYQRITFGEIDPDIVVTAHVVNDLVRMLAELFDNATRFSPPNSQVSVGAERIGDYVLVQIEDYGIGMPREQMDAVNSRRPDGDPVDVTTFRTMGLAVVARLAQRYQIRVELRANPEGGTIANLSLPAPVLKLSHAPGLELARPALPRPEARPPSAPLAGTGLPSRIPGEAAMAARLTSPAPAGGGRADRYTAGATPADSGSPGRLGDAGAPLPARYGADPSGMPERMAGMPAAAMAVPGPPDDDDDDDAGAWPMPITPGLVRADGDDYYDAPPTVRRNPSLGGSGGAGYGSQTGAAGGPEARRDVPTPPWSPDPAAGRVPTGYGYDPSETGRPQAAVDVPTIASLPTVAPRRPVDASWYEAGGAGTAGGVPAATGMGSTGMGSTGMGSTGMGSTGMPRADAPVADRPGRPRSAWTDLVGGEEQPQQSWTTAADEGWRAASAAAQPEVGGITDSGLPRRIPLAQLVPGGVEKEPEPAPLRREPEEVRGLLTAYHRGVQRGRSGGAASPFPPGSAAAEEMRP